MGDPHLIARIALILFIPLSVLLCAYLRPAQACATIFLSAIMFLPRGVAFDFAGVPPLGRQEIASICVLANCLLFYPRLLWAAKPGRGLDVLIFVLLIGGVATALTNGDILTYGPRVLPRMRPYDALSESIRDLLRYAVPFFLARALFRSSRDLRSLLMTFAIAGVVYSAFVLVELRLSPQFHRWVYGFHAHSFAQHVRFGGYRPMVFMGSGLSLALFIAVIVVLTSALGRARVIVLQMKGSMVAAYLAMVLVACKSFAAMTWGLLGAFLVFALSPRRQIMMAGLLAGAVMIYPLLRLTDMIPLDSVVSAIASVSESRAESMEYRFRHEVGLIEKANERVLLGWGAYGRNRAYDPIRGKNLSVTDGFWIITLGKRGTVGLLATFGLLTSPVLVAWRRFRWIRDPVDRNLIGGLALAVALSTADLLPNGLFTYLQLMLAGALLGSVQGIAGQRRYAPADRQEAEPAAGPVEASEDSAPRGREASLGAARKLRSARL